MKHLSPSRLSSQACLEFCLEKIALHYLLATAGDVFVLEKA